MILLLTHGLPSILRLRAEGINVGRLLQPRHVGNEQATQDAGIVWAADNDAYNGFDAERYVAMLERLVPGAAFVAAPDVVGDAETTLRWFEEWEPILRARDLPVGLVMQDGQEDRPVPWSAIEAAFIGGTTRWKMSPKAGALAAEAKRRGKWVHVGRVNSIRRMTYARSVGADSVDGTQWVRFIDTHKHLARRGLETDQLALGVW